MRVGRFRFRLDCLVGGRVKHMDCLVEIVVEHMECPFEEAVEHTTWRHPYQQLATSPEY